MARRMTLEGAKVLACVEVMPYSGGLNRNIVQCLNDFDIPLYLSHTVTDIQGTGRVEWVIVSAVDENRTPIPGTEMVFDCDTVLLSVGLIPENELSREAGIVIDPRTNGPVVYENMETSIPGVFACGNVVHVHDLVDFVTAESQRAGKAAAAYCAAESIPESRLISLQSGTDVGYTVPQKIRLERAGGGVTVFFRVRSVYHGAKIIVQDDDGQQIASFARDHLAPGEMESIKLPYTLLEKAHGALTVSVKKGGLVS
jgi:NADPH-dependent 2,4-dienoyl-CoA reductase/sulfur reductase-like enzyme